MNLAKERRVAFAWYNILGELMDKGDPYKLKNDVDLIEEMLEDYLKIPLNRIKKKV